VIHSPHAANLEEFIIIQQKTYLLQWKHFEKWCHSSQRTTISEIWSITYRMGSHSVTCHST